MALKQVKVSEVTELLRNGYTRYKKDAEGFLGSVEEKLDLTPQQCKQLFDHAKIKGIRVTSPSSLLEIIDEDDATEEEAVDAVQAAPVTLVHATFPTEPAPVMEAAPVEEAIDEAKLEAAIEEVATPVIEPKNLFL